VQGALHEFTPHVANAKAFAFCEMQAVWFDCAHATHAGSAAHALNWLQQLCLMHVAHAVSPGAAGQVPPPASPPTKHWEWHLASSQLTSAAAFAFCERHAICCELMQVTQAMSLAHAART
jgi:hypothetical protein